VLKSAAMPLPLQDVERELTHTRRVRFEGYKRADGRWDIEAHLSDIKNHDFHLQTGVRRAGQPIHEMWLRSPSTAISRSWMRLLPWTRCRTRAAAKPSCPLTASSSV